MEKGAIWITAVVCLIVWMSVIALFLFPPEPSPARPLQMETAEKEPSPTSSSPSEMPVKREDDSEGLTRAEIEELLIEDKVSIDVLLDWLSNKKD
ncbi:hypothetical protein HF072_03515 [Bacillus sp. RO3]|nr:hypothetical protein [Bacillus sp. RO3]